MYNYTAQDVVDALTAFKLVRPYEPVYIATGVITTSQYQFFFLVKRSHSHNVDLLASELDQLAPFRKTFNAKAHFDFPEFVNSLHIVDNDYLGAIEVRCNIRERSTTND
jgi:hypothetical protein